MQGALSFSIPGDPRGKGRPRATARGGFVKLYTDAKTASYENLVALAAQRALAGSPQFTGSLQLEVVMSFAPPKSASKRVRAAMLAGEIAHTKKPDASNVLKAVEDGMNGIAFADDCQITRLIGEKIYAETPGVQVRLTPRSGGAA